MARTLLDTRYTNQGGNMKLTSDEIEDIRFCLAQVAQADEDKVVGDLPETRTRALVEQAERFRALARKLTD